MIVDANRVGRFLADPPDEDVAPLRNWIESGKGQMVYSTGGQFAEEIGGKARQRFGEYYRAGIARRISHDDFAEIEQDLRNDRRLRSDDPHVLALARYSGARLLFSGDPDLIKDFKSPHIINKPRGKVYSGAGNTGLLKRSHCPMG